MIAKKQAYSDSNPHYLAQLFGNPQSIACFCIDPQYLTQLYSNPHYRNSPLAKAMIEMIENPPPPFELSDNDEKTEDVLIGKRECK